MTRLFDLTRDFDAGLAAAATALRSGGVVIFPTETFYGLAVDPLNRAAVERLVDLKSRLPHKPIPLVAADTAACAAAARLDPVLVPLCETFWPGPLTLALPPLHPEVWHLAIAGEHASLGIRVSSHAVARALAVACGGLVTSTSANFASVAPVAVCAALDPALVAGVDVVLDGGALHGGLASTVLRLVHGRVEILREGAVSRDELARWVPL